MLLISAQAIHELVPMSVEESDVVVMMRVRHLKEGRGEIWKKREEGISDLPFTWLCTQAHESLTILNTCLSPLTCTILFLFSAVARGIGGGREYRRKRGGKRKMKISSAVCSRN